MLPRDCPYCLNNECTFLGALGHTRHYRCRACGMTFSKTPKARRPVARQATQEEIQIAHARLALAAGKVRFEVQP